MNEWIIDGNRSINIIDCYQHAISIDYLFSQTFQLSISSSTNKVNRVWTTTASQVSWIFAMTSKLNRSSLYYWQRDMLIVLIICAVFHGATSMNNSQTLLLRFKYNKRSAFTPAIPEDKEETWFSANRSGAPNKNPLKHSIVESILVFKR